MSPSDIKINVSGGNANFGNLNQGDNAVLHVSQSIQFEQADIEAFYEAIMTLAKQRDISDSDYLRLRNSVNKLVHDPDQPGIMTTITTLYDTYGWATKPLMALFTAAIP